MAKVKVGDLGKPNDFFTGFLTLDINAAGTEAVYTDDVTGETIVLEGRGLERSSDNDDFFSGGTITSVTVNNEKGAEVLDLTGGHYAAVKLLPAFLDGNFKGVLAFLMAGKDTVEAGKYSATLYGFGGNDRITGGKADDDIIGGAGSDVMTGGGGSDHFEFTPRKDGGGKDVITDFSIKGHNADELEIHGDFSVKAAGSDTLLKFDDGGSLLLEHVKKTAFEHYWDHAS
jgi:Ca2+-binding RTX toxin-like protein